jgi:hypothetical protein
MLVRSTERGDNTPYGSISRLVKEFKVIAVKLAAAAYV